jgi:hypothetical protein
MIDGVVAFVGVVMFAAGVVVGANWRASRRSRSRLTLPAPRRAAGGGRE